MKNEDIAIYIHIPFCRRKCSYCSFVSYAHCEENIPDYVEALKQELTMRANDRVVPTIFIGGGTPSLLSVSQIADIFATIHNLYKISPDAEITMEVNPGTIDKNYLDFLRGIGVNRLSIGVQSLNDDELKLLGRIHSADDAREAVLCARKAGFGNLNLDFIYGIPGQSNDSWMNSLNGAIELECDHISLYALTLDEDVPMRHAIERGDLTRVESDLAADCYEIAEDILEIHNYNHYELSNWAKCGYECRHNMVYWHNQPYLGFGVAAHSSFEARRFANTGNLDQYIQTFTEGKELLLDTDETILPELQTAESIILGLRLSQGVNLGEIGGKQAEGLAQHYSAEINELSDLGLLELVGERILLTRRGRLLGNEVFYRFLPL